MLTGAAGIKADWHDLPMRLKPREELLRPTGWASLACLALLSLSSSVTLAKRSDTSVTHEPMRVL